jgi:hypothetical protein
MKLPRIRPYKTFLIDDDRKRTRLDAHEIVLERPIGVDLEINLAPHPRFRGRVSFSTFRGNFVLEPESGGGLYLFIENWPRDERRRKENRRRERTPLCHVYAVDARGQKTAISGRSFAVQVGRGLELKVDLTTAHSHCFSAPQTSSTSRSREPRG